MRDSPRSGEACLCGTAAFRGSSVRPSSRCALTSPAPPSARRRPSPPATPASRGRRRRPAPSGRPRSARCGPVPTRRSPTPVLSASGSAPPATTTSPAARRRPGSIRASPLRLSPTEHHRPRPPGLLEVDPEPARGGAGPRTAAASVSPSSSPPAGPPRMPSSSQAGGKAPPWSFATPRASARAKEPITGARIRPPFPSETFVEWRRRRSRPLAHRRYGNAAPLGRWAAP